VTKKVAKRTREFYVTIEEGEDGYYIADVPELPGCHTQGKTLDELMENIKEAIELYLEVQGEGHRTKFIGIQKVTI